MQLSLSILAHGRYTKDVTTENRRFATMKNV